MARYSPLKTAVLFVLPIAAVISLSLLSNRIWGGQQEQAGEIKKPIIEQEMTVAQFGRVNDLPNPVLKVFQLWSITSRPLPLFPGFFHTARKISAATGPNTAGGLRLSHWQEKLNAAD